MAKKAELLEAAAKLKLEVTSKNTIAEIEAALKAAEEKKGDEKEVVTERKAEVAKAGKRSEKAAHEAEEKAEKEARKAAHDTSAHGEAEAHIKRGPVPVTRPKSERHGKKFKEVAKKLETGKAYTLAEAIQLASETSPVKFDATVEVHVVLGVDPRQADQNIRTTVTLATRDGQNDSALPHLYLLTK